MELAVEPAVALTVEVAVKLIPDGIAQATVQSTTSRAVAQSIHG